MAIPTYHDRLVGRAPSPRCPLGQDAPVPLPESRAVSPQMGSLSPHAISQISPYIAETKSFLTAEAAQNWVRFVIHPAADVSPTHPAPNGVRSAIHLPAARRPRAELSPSPHRSRIVESSGMRQAFALLLIATSLPLWAAQPVRARHGMVVSRERHATTVGLEVLRNGGNAIDAAAAVGLALAVTHPSAGNIGGGGFMLIRLADGRTTFIDFRERAPLSASRNMYLDAAGEATQDSVTGYRGAAVPGTVRGLEYAVKKYGRKPWAELVHPAVELAAKGLPVSYGPAQSLRAARGLSGFPESKRIFLKNGKFYEAGEL